MNCRHNLTGKDEYILVKMASRLDLDFYNLFGYTGCHSRFLSIVLLDFE